MSPLAYINGRFIPDEQLALSWQDAGLVYGATATDLIRTFGHKPFRLHDHIARFRQSCALCHVPLSDSDADLAVIAERLMYDNARLIPMDTDLALVMLATPGPLGRFTGANVDGPPTLVMHTYPLQFQRIRCWFVEGAHVVIPSTRHVANTAVSRMAKQRSRMHWWIAGREAATIDPAAVALLLDDAGHVTETASANLIAVYGKELVTPAQCLPGISLAVVRELANANGYQVSERELTPQRCANADELLLTSTTFGIAGVSRLDEHKFRWPGPVYRSLLSAYSQLVGIDVEAQLQAAL